MKLYLPILFLICGLLAACSDRSSRGPAADSVSTSAPEQIAEPDTSGIHRWTANSRSAKHEVTGSAILGDVRTSTAPGYDRIVFAFVANQIPSWKIGYTEKPVRSCGSGKDVSFKSRYLLEIRLAQTDAHDTTGHPTTWREKDFNYRNLSEMKLSCDFEGVTTYVAGLSSAGEYRVIELTDPSRLVIDIKN